MICQRQIERYSDTVGELCRLHCPDLVLIDGRFRIACALKAIKELVKYDDWILVVDDFIGRESYKIITEYAEIYRVIGTTAFLKKKIFLKDINLDILKYKNNWY